MCSKRAVLSLSGHVWWLPGADRPGVPPDDLPQLLRNFLYKVPTLLSSSSLLGVIDWMRYLFSRDLLIAEVLLPPEDYLSGLWRLCN